MSLGSGLWVPASLRDFVKLYWCDSGWWWCQLNTSWWRISLSSSIIITVVIINIMSGSFFCLENWSGCIDRSPLQEQTWKKMVQGFSHFESRFIIIVGSLDIAPHISVSFNSNSEIPKHLFHFFYLRQTERCLDKMCSIQSLWEEACRKESVNVLPSLTLKGFCGNPVSRDWFSKDSFYSSLFVAYH